MKAATLGLVATFLAGMIALEGRETALAAPPEFGTDDKPSAEGVNSYDFYVADTVAYDSNLYRLPSSYAVATAVAPNASRADEFDIASVGVDGQWSFGRQEISLNARVDDTRFSRNRFLDQVGGLDTLQWNWRIGSVLSGQVGQDYVRSLASFQETRVLGRDILTSSDYYGTARYQLGPHWGLFGGITDAKIKHSDVVAALGDSHTKSGHGGIDYAQDIDRTFGAEYQYLIGSFRPGYTLAGIPFNGNFSQNKVTLFTKYAVTDKTFLDASAGFLRRSYSEAPIAPFSGGVWNVSLKWQPTAKTQLVVAEWRDLHAYVASETDYFVSDGASISPIWSVSEKIQLSLVASLEREHYIPSSPSALLLGSRRDTTRYEQAAVNYSPIRALSLSFSYRNESRSSNQRAYAYGDESAKAGFNFKF